MYYGTRHSPFQRLDVWLTGDIDTLCRYLISRHARLVEYCSSYAQSRSWFEFPGNARHLGLR